MSKGNRHRGAGHEDPRTLRSSKQALGRQQARPSRRAGHKNVLGEPPLEQRARESVPSGARPLATVGERGDAKPRSQTAPRSKAKPPASARPSGAKKRPSPSLTGAKELAAKRKLAERGGPAAGGRSRVVRLARMMWGAAETALTLGRAAVGRLRRRHPE